MQGVRVDAQAVQGGQVSQRRWVQVVVEFLEEGVPGRHPVPARHVMGYEFVGAGCYVVSVVGAKVGGGRHGTQ